MDIKIQLNRDEIKDLKSYCDLNKLDIGDTIKQCYLSGFRIEKYGLLNNSSQPIEVEKIVIKEVIKEVPVEKIVIKEIIKEVPVEKIIVKEISVDNFKQDDEKTKQLQTTILKLKTELNDLSKNLSECKSAKDELVNSIKNNSVNYLRSSNLDDNIY